MANAFPREKELFTKGSKYYSLMLSFKLLNKSKEIDCYIIQKKWLQGWKDFVNYKAIKKYYLDIFPSLSLPDKLPSEYDSSKVPFYKEKIQNENLIEKITDPHSHQLTFLNKKRYNDMRFISKETWEFFLEDYEADCCIKIFKKKGVRYPHGFQLNLKECYSCNHQNKLKYYCYDRSEEEENNKKGLTKSSSTPNGLINQSQSTYLAKNNSGVLKTTKEEMKSQTKTLLKPTGSLIENNSKGNLSEKETPIKQPTLTPTPQRIYNLSFCRTKQRPLRIQTKEFIDQVLRYGGNKGLHGLNNLGNTCYMNAALQCVSNCDLLSKYLLFEFKDEELKKRNEADTGGKLALTYIDLLKALWLRKDSSYSPDQFKRAIGKYQPIFSDYSQQDAHEVMSYFLNGLNVELNHAPNKQLANEPCTYEDEALCEKKLNVFLNKQQTRVIELLYGMYKSEIHCQNYECQGVTKIFETFLSFQCTMTVNYVQCVFVYYDISKSPIKFRMAIEKDKTIGHFRAVVHQIFKVKPFSFLIAFVEKNRIKGLLNCQSTVREYNELYCYQIDPQFTQDEAYIQVHPSQEEIFAVLNKRTPVVVNAEAQNAVNIFESLLTDNNNNLSSDLVKVLIDVQFFPSTLSRIIYINKTWSNFQLELHIKNYLFPLLNQGTIGITKVFAKKTFKITNATLNENVIPSELKKSLLPFNSYLFYKPQFQEKGEDKFSLEVHCSKMKDKLPSISSISLPFDDRSTVYLEHIIKQFGSKEKLLGQWRCIRCSQLSVALKKMSVYTCSVYLLINLKRFKDDRKNCALVIFPLYGLDMSQYSDNPNQFLTYDLIAVINHSGSLNGGHYYTYAKNVIDQQWYCFNDSRVRSISDSSIIQADASTLMYKRRDNSDK